MGTLNKLAAEIHKNAVDHGFYADPPDISRSLMLIVSELVEVMEADRNHHLGASTDLLDESLEEESFQDEYRRLIKGSPEDEWADALIRILDNCCYRGIDIDKHVRLKMKYNALREYKHRKKY
jgi:hypothetical protein